MGTPDSREYDRLVERNFEPYSKGHRMMYLRAIERMGNIAGPRGARVIEAGFGIGWGVDQMLAQDVLKSYVGYEPNKNSYLYVANPLKTHQRVDDLVLFNLPFEANLDPAFDFAFCIEVIEHVPMDRHLDFLKGLHKMAPTLFFSTPDIRRAPEEGVRTTEAWRDMLREAGYGLVRIDPREWTTLYTAAR